MTILRMCLASLVRPTVNEDCGYKALAVDCRQAARGFGVVNREFIGSCSFLRQIGFKFFGQMLTKLMRKHGGIKPVEGILALVDQFNQRIEHLGFLPRLIPEAKLVATFHKAQSLHRFLIRHTLLLPSSQPVLPRHSR